MNKKFAFIAVQNGPRETGKGIGFKYSNAMIAQSSLWGDIY